jgi:hypothetical protein
VDTNQRLQHTINFFVAAPFATDEVSSLAKEVSFVAHEASLVIDEGSFATVED